MIKIAAGWHPSRTLPPFLAGLTDVRCVPCWSENRAEELENVAMSSCVRAIVFFVLQCCHLQCLLRLRCIQCHLNQMTSNAP